MPAASGRGIERGPGARRLRPRHRRCSSRPPAWPSTSAGSTASTGSSRTRRTPPPSPPPTRSSAATRNANADHRRHRTRSTRNFLGDPNGVVASLPPDPPGLRDRAPGRPSLPPERDPGLGRRGPRRGPEQHQLHLRRDRRARQPADRRARPRRSSRATSCRSPSAGSSTRRARTPGPRIPARTTRARSPTSSRRRTRPASARRPTRRFGRRRTPDPAFDAVNPGSGPDEPRPDPRDPRAGRPAEQRRRLPRLRRPRHPQLRQRRVAALLQQGRRHRTNANTLKAMEAGWITNGYPGPEFPPVDLAARPERPGRDHVRQRHRHRDRRPEQPVRAGRRGPRPRSTPATSWRSRTSRSARRGQLALPTSGTTANAGSLKVSRNQAFSGTVTLSTLADLLDPQNPLVTGTMTGGASSITYTPNPVTPSLGSGRA